jgi:hypothetical protein
LSTQSWVLALPLPAESKICSLSFMNACSHAARIRNLSSQSWVLAPPLPAESKICSRYFMSACSHAARIRNLSTQSWVLALPLPAESKICFPYFMSSCSSVARKFVTCILWALAPPLPGSGICISSHEFLLPRCQDLEFVRCIVISVCSHTAGI